MKLNPMPASCLTIMTLAALSVAPVRTEALNQYQYQSIANGGRYTASASYYGSASTNATFDLDQDSGIRRLALGAQSYYAAISNALNEAMGTVGPSVTLAYPGVLTGTLQASMTALPNGNLGISVGGVRFAAQFASHHTQWGLLKISCYTYLSIVIGSSTSEFNPISGAITAGQPNVGVSSNTSCDSNFSWVPYFGDYINTVSVRTADAMVAKQSGSLGSMLDVQPQLALFGFVSAISSNTYLLGGVDLGMFLRNNIAGLYAGKQMAITIGDPAAVYAPTIKNTAGPSHYTRTSFSVMFSDNGIDTAGFKVDETHDYLWKQLVPDDER